MQDNNNPFNNLGFLAGLAMMRGVPADQAYLNTAMSQEKLYDAQRQRAEYERMQYARQALPQIAQKVYNSSPQEAFNELVGIGLDPKEALSLIDSIMKQKTPETFKGPGDLQYSKSINPETGQLEATPLPGQMSESVSPPTASEIRVNANTISELNEGARAAERELRLLEDSEKAFEAFDKNTGSYTGASTLASKIPSKGLGKGAENLLYNKEAQTAKQQIAKLNSQLFQNRVQSLGARATDAAKEQIAQGLPTIELTPEARRDVLMTKKRENFSNILRSSFFDQWYKQNNKNLLGAEEAFNSFIRSNELLDNKGNINRSLLGAIPKAINEYKNTSFTGTGNGELEQLADSVSIEDIMAALKGK